MYRHWSFLSTVLIAVVVGQAQDVCTPSGTECNFYEDCLEAIFPCGDGGYAIHYGFRLCKKFQENRVLFSPLGKMWVSATCFCLQNILAGSITSGTFNATTTCTDIENFAWATHLGCYTDTNPSVCNIPITDWIMILNTAKESFNDLRSYELVAQVGHACGTQYYEEVVKILNVII
ncbi:hypothetical protein HA402_008657 [Bradysia odoriphaga]|nr:hypothetical protein HA402_008657 [Bradysia odoriphaga]